MIPSRTRIQVCDHAAAVAKALVPNKKVYDNLEKQQKLQRETGGGTAVYQTGDVVVNPGRGDTWDEDYLSSIHASMKEFENGSTEEKKSTVQVSMC